jgi:hypothetical protein
LMPDAGREASELRNASLKVNEVYFSVST